MSPHQLIAVAVRLFAIWLAIYAVRYVPAVFLQIEKFGEGPGAAISLGVCFVVIGVLLILWFFPRTIAKKLLPGSPPPEQQTFPLEDWFAVGCSLIGVWVMTESIPGLVRYLVILFISQRMGPEAFPVTPDFYVGAIYYLLQGLLAAWLILGTKGLKRLFIRLRHAE